jgi:hypothetical protein
VPEIVGAWLHLWVPPRDVEVPPVPWRKLALWGGIGAVILAAALVVMIPRIDSGKDKRNAAYRAQLHRAAVAHRLRVLHEQRPRHASDPALKPPAGADPAQVAAARTALVHKVEASILADAKARGRTGEMRKVSGPTICSPTPGTPTGQAVGSFDCFTITKAIARTSRSVAGTIGYPFRAVVDFKNYSYSWCKTEQIPGEQLIPDPRTVVQLPAACRIVK